MSEEQDKKASHVDSDVTATEDNAVKSIAELSEQDLDKVADGNVIIANSPVTEALANTQKRGKS